jgi:thiol:disulfide interchange protein/DsbC/DsbD-like thiol-disulfide interchange protein
VKHFLASIGLLLAAALPVQAQDAGPHVQARLVTEDSAVPPGGSVTIALVEDIRAGWHTYWVNPGDAGAATEIKWTLPHGWGAGAIQWPTPKRLPVGPLMDYGYEGQPWLLQKLTIPANAKAGDTVTLKAAVSWLVCKDVCLPEDAALTLALRIGPAAIDPALTKDFATARSLMPVASPWTLTYSLGKTLDLYAAAPALAAAHPAEASFFPGKTDVVDGDAKQTLDFTKDGLVLHLAPASKVTKVGGALTGVLVLKSTDGSIQALTVDALPGSVLGAITGSNASGGRATAEITLWVAILSAFVGGLILNAMPCVLPILAMKALGLAKHSGGEHKQAAREGSAYSAGAILSFLVLGLVIVLLRRGGAAVGWGFQLQEPVAVAGFALLIFAVGLNLSGVFEIGSITMGDSLAARSGLLGAFFTGVLAVAVAAPCTAPFMAAALGFALTQSTTSAMLIFFSLGIGFALPFLILGLWPRALSFLPKPGTWMLRLKQFLAFPMYGAAAWLTWVLAQEAGPNGVVVLLAAMVAISLAAWLWGVTRNLSNAGRGIGVAATLMIVAAILYGLATLSGTAAPPATAASPAAEGFTDAKLAALRASGQPVFVDATAAWCITCLVNEKAVLSRASVKDAFAQRHIAYLVADWTNRNAAITRLLRSNGRSGVPLYLYYPPGADKPVVLPQILTEAEIISAIGF